MEPDEVKVEEVAAEVAPETVTETSPAEVPVEEVASVEPTELAAPIE